MPRPVSIRGSFPGLGPLGYGQATSALIKGPVRLRVDVNEAHPAHSHGVYMDSVAIVQGNEDGDEEGLPWVNRLTLSWGV